MSPLQKFNSSGTYLISIGTHGAAHGGSGYFFNDMGMAVDAVGNAYVYDMSDNASNTEIDKFGPIGRISG